MVSAQYLRGARRGEGHLLAGKPKILGEGENENLYPPLVLMFLFHRFTALRGNELVGVLATPLYVALRQM